LEPLSVFREIAPMSLQDLDPLKIYVVLSPFVVFLLGLAVYWLTGWMDRREERRHHGAE
jgi:hypothetical protein